MKRLGNPYAAFSSPAKLILRNHARCTAVTLFAAAQFFAAHSAHCQIAPAAQDGGAAQVDLSNSSNQTAALESQPDQQALASAPPVTLKPPPERDITVEGLASYGNYRIFAATTNSHIYDGGIEYDRHSWHRFLGARMDYVGEVLPVVILRQPTNVDIYGITVNQTKKTVYGFDISPIGFRWMWFDKHTIKPYVMAKGGIIAFSQKVPTSKSTYENMTLQSAMGLQVRMSPRYDLRLGLFGDFHFSNGFITPVNPGLDVMNAQIGLTYHVGPGRGFIH